MQADNILKKAKRLGIDTGNGINQIDTLHYIADQVGVDDLVELEETLDNMLQQQNDNIEALDSFQDSEDIDTLDYNSEQSQGREKFGEREYNNAKDETGKYDKNYYKSRQQELDKKLEDAKHEKSINNKKVGIDENGRNKYKDKNIVDKTRDRLNVAKTRQDAIQNKLSNAKSNAYRAMHPGEALKDAAKDKAKNVASNAGKKVGQAAAKAGKVAGKAVGKAAMAAGKAIISFLMANPIVLVIVIGVLLILLILILFFGGSSSFGENLGYYDTECNFNDTTVNLTICDSSMIETISLEEYVIGTTYSYVKDKNYSDNTIKTLMIIIKTNALSLGNYSSSLKSVNIDDCNKEFIHTASISSNELNNLNNIYRTIEEELFVSSSYTTTISNLNSQSSLDIDENIIEEIEILSKSMEYSDILNKIYNNDSNEAIVENNNKNTIFVGDSRTNWLKNYGIVSDSNSVYAGAMGYYWFNGTVSSTFNANTYNCKSNAIECINEKIGNEPSNIVIWLGVNDATNYENYYNKYYQLATGEWAENTIYIVSVGYVDDTRSPYVKNSQISIFNDYMQRSISGSGLSNLKYIDLGYNEKTMADGTVDGVHYGSSFSKEIYNNIVDNVGSISSISSNKQIYKLSNYCTYYTLTENDAYWWPIGSSNSTGNNIYGGSPTTTYISSGFGPRTINGKYSNHKGIDIAGDCQSNIIIATKSGTVTKVNNTCNNNGSYGNKCGGGYGNYVIIDHEDGTSSVYAHMYPNSITVSVNDVVKQGEKIGLMGNSGSSTGCHLHFEIRLNNIQVNPLNYISADNPRPVNQYTIVSVDDNSSNPEENKVALCKSLLNSGFSKNAVAGMMVNIQAEGAFSTNNLEGCYEENQCCFNNTYGFCKHPEITGFGSDEAYTAGVDNGTYSRDKFINDHAGYGLIQWTSSGRKAGLYDYAKSKNKSIAALSIQLGYLLEEIKQPSYSITYKYITGNYSAYDIANNFCLDFESPKNEKTTCPARASSNISSMLSFVENGCS